LTLNQPFAGASGSHGAGSAHRITFGLGHRRGCTKRFFDSAPQRVDPNLDLV